MSVKIRLKRYGTRKKPYYRVVAVDSRKPRDGRTIEELGLYQPIEKEEKQLVLREDRIREWMDHGARPSNTVRRLLNKKEIYIK